MEQHTFIFIYYIFEYLKNYYIKVSLISVTNDKSRFKRKKIFDFHEPKLNSGTYEPPMCTAL